MVGAVGMGGGGGSIQYWVWVVGGLKISAGGVGTSRMRLS